MLYSIATACKNQEEERRCEQTSTLRNSSLTEGSILRSSIISETPVIKTPWLRSERRARIRGTKFSARSGSFLTMRSAQSDAFRSESEAYLFPDVAVCRLQEFLDLWCCITGHFWARNIGQSTKGQACYKLIGVEKISKLQRITYPFKVLVTSIRTS